MDCGFRMRDAPRGLSFVGNRVRIRLSDKYRFSPLSRWVNGNAKSDFRPRAPRFFFVNKKILAGGFSALFAQKTPRSGGYFPPVA